MSPVQKRLSVVAIIAVTAVILVIANLPERSHCAEGKNGVYRGPVPVGMHAVWDLKCPSQMRWTRQ